MKRLSFPVVGSLLLGAVVLVGVSTWRDRPEPVAVPATADARGQLTKVLLVENMTCATCPITVKAAMTSVKGVTAVAVDFDTKKATVTFDPAIATVDQIAEASTNAGYPARPVL